jgi:hypothetical protein
MLSDVVAGCLIAGLGDRVPLFKREGLRIELVRHLVKDLVIALLLLSSALFPLCSIALSMLLTESFHLPEKLFLVHR